jgi:hypothetical protein
VEAVVRAVVQRFRIRREWESSNALTNEGGIRGPNAEAAMVGWQRDFYFPAVRTEVKEVCSAGFADDEKKPIAALLAERSLDPQRLAERVLLAVSDRHMSRGLHFLQKNIHKPTAT